MSSVYDFPMFLAGPVLAPIRIFCLCSLNRYMVNILALGFGSWSRTPRMRFVSGFFGAAKIQLTQIEGTLDNLSAMYWWNSSIYRMEIGGFVLRTMELG